MSDLRETLRHMLAALETERQALAALDLDKIMGSANDKHHLCETLEGMSGAGLDAECRGMLEAAQRQNAVNRRVRNLVAANVATRLDALLGRLPVYKTGTTCNFIPRSA